MEIRADLYREGHNGVEFEIESALQTARAAVAHAHARALAHVLFTVRSEEEGGKCPARHVLRLLQLGLRLGCEVVDIEANMLPATRSALQLWLHRHFGSSSPLISAVLSSVHVTNPAVFLHDPHMCCRGLAAAAACNPAPHALKFAAVVTDAVACARMQQQAQQAQDSYGVPVCCVAMAGGGSSSSVAAVSRLHCATLTFCRPLSAATPTAQGCPSSPLPRSVSLARDSRCAGQLTVSSLRLMQLHLHLHPLQLQQPHTQRPLRLLLFGCVAVALCLPSSSNSKLISCACGNDISKLMTNRHVCNSDAGPRSSCPPPPQSTTLLSRFFFRCRCSAVYFRLLLAQCDRVPAAAAVIRMVRRWVLAACLCTTRCRATAPRR